MKQLADMATLVDLCKGSEFRVMRPQKTPSDPMVLLKYVKGRARLTFLLKKLVPDNVSSGFIQRQPPSLMLTVCTSAITPC